MYYTWKSLPKRLRNFYIWKKKHEFYDILVKMVYYEDKIQATGDALPT